MSTLITFSQEQENDIVNPFKKNTVFFELGALSHIWGVHYERVLFDFDNNKVAACVGYAMVDMRNHIEVMPIRLRLIFGTQKHFFQFEKGFFYYTNKSFGTRNKDVKSLFNSIGIQYTMRTKKGLYTQIGLITSFSSSTVYVFPGIGIGFSI